MPDDAVRQRAARGRTSNANSERVTLPAAGVGSAKDCLSMKVGPFAPLDASTRPIFNPKAQKSAAPTTTTANP
jgi:hypothetical protein